MTLAIISHGGDLPPFGDALAGACGEKAAGTFSRIRAWCADRQPGTKPGSPKRQKGLFLHGDIREMFLLNFPRRFCVGAFLFPGLLQRVRQDLCRKLADASPRHVRVLRSFRSRPERNTETLSWSHTKNAYRCKA